MIISCCNAKGGTGKTFWSSMILYYLAKRGDKKLYACDLDVAQKNFTGNICDYKNNSDKNGGIFDSVEFIEFADLKFLRGDKATYCICDTPPATWDKKYLKLLEISDLLIFPLILDKYSGQGIQNLLEQAGDKPFRIIANKFAETATQAAIYKFLVNDLRQNVSIFKNVEWLNSNIQQGLPIDRGVRQDEKVWLQNFVNNLLYPIEKEEK